MIEKSVNLTLKEMSISFDVEDGTNRIVSSGAIPISKDSDSSLRPSLTKAICEKCEDGELVFNPNKEYTDNSFTHTCLNCENTEVFDKIYPAISFIDDNTLDDLKEFIINFSPVFKDKNNSESNM